VNVSNEIEQVVRDKYGQVAQSNLSSHDSGVRAVAEAFGYTPDELAAIPASANMGLSCGNPTAFASLREGETVVDLGSGGGLDVFLAAKKVGATGRAIGIDMTPQMVQRAKNNASEGEYSNVEFHLAQIDKMPLNNGSADCIISNCVINLASDKQAVFLEIFRVLKPGGRVAVSDIALKKPLPPELAKDLMAYVGCVAGAISVEDYRRGLLAAGFSHVHVVDAGSDLNAYTKIEGQSGCCSPAMEKRKTELPVTAASCSGPTCCQETVPTKSVHEALASIAERYDVNDYAASVKVYAVKPK